MSDTAQNKDGVGAILDKFFIMRAGTPDDDLEELKLRNEMGEPEKELATQIEDFYRSKILEARKDSLKKLVSDMDEMGRLTQYKQIRTHTIKCIDDITAQLNSRGDSDG